MSRSTRAMLHNVSFVTMQVLDSSPPQAATKYGYNRYDYSQDNQPKKEVV